MRPHRSTRSSTRPGPRRRRRGVTGGGEEKGRRRAPPPHAPTPPSAAGRPRSPGRGRGTRGQSRSAASGRRHRPGGHPRQGLRLPGRQASPRGRGWLCPAPPGLPAVDPAAGRHGTAERGPGGRWRAAATAARHFLTRPNFAGRSRPGRRRRAEPPPR